jgi:sorting nexin-1/2
LIELWETFLLQLDAEEDGQEAFYKPPASAAASAAVQSTDDGSRPNEAEIVSETATATDVALEQGA